MMTPMQCASRMALAGKLVASVSLLMLAACSTAPSYQVPPEQTADAARIRGTVNMEHTIFGDWYHFSLHAVDGILVSPVALRISDSKPRPIESGQHEVMLECEGREDGTFYHATAMTQATFLPGTTYTVNGKIAVDKVIFWIERDGSGEKVTPEMTSQRLQERPTGTVYMPIILPKK